MSAEAEDRAAAEAAGISPEQQAAMTAYHSEENFLLLHRPQLEAMQLPQHLWSRLYNKIYTEQFDALSIFCIAQEEDGVGFHLIVEKEEGVKAGQDVWIFDHAWEVKEADALRSLSHTPGLVDHLWNLMDLDRRTAKEEEERRVKRAADEEEARRREDRKESEVAEEERKRKEAEDEKQKEREQEDSWCNDEAIACVVTQTQASRDTAAAALKASRGDLIDAINSITSSTPPPSRPLPSTTSSSTDPSSLSDDEQRAKTVWESLFRYHYIHPLYTTSPREDRRPLTASDVILTLYVDDEGGSAINAGVESNARVAGLMCVTLGVGFTVMWTTKDLEQGEEVIKPIRPALKQTREWRRV